MSKIKRVTPQEARLRAQNTIAQRNAFIKQNRPATTTQANAVNKQKANANVALRVAATSADVNANVLKGALKGLEGIHDFSVNTGLWTGLGGLGLLLNLIPEYREAAKKHVEKDIVGETLHFNDLDNFIDQASYLEDMGKAGEIVEGVASGVGQMLPAVAVTVATGGAGAPSAIVQAASLTTTGVSAAGNATEEAYKDGADYWKGLGYGALSGGVEAGTEAAFGGLTKGIHGPGFLDNVLKSGANVGADTAAKAGAKVGAQRVIKGMLEEGAEEAAAELASPALKTIYKGKDALEEYGEGEYWAGVGEAALVGGLTAAAYGGTLGRIKKLGGGSSLAKDAEAVLEDVEYQKKKAYKLSSEDKLSQEQAVNIQKTIKADIELLEKQMKKAPEKTRAKLLEQGLNTTFDEQGNIRPEAMEQLDKHIAAAADTTYDHRYRSIELDADTITDSLERAGTTAFSGELNETQQSNFKNFKQMFNAMASKSKGSMKFVLGNESMSDNGLWIGDNDVMILSPATLENGNATTELAKMMLTDTFRETTVHEGYHAIEGTTSANTLKEHLRSNTSVYKDAIEKYLNRGYSKAYFDSIKAKGQKRVGALIDIVQKSQNGQILTDAEARVLENFESEWPAFAAQNVLNTDEFARHLVRENLGTVEKLLGTIQDIKKHLSNQKSADAKKAAAFVKKTEQLYLNALEEIGAKYVDGKIVQANQEDDERKNSIKHSFVGRTEDGRGIYRSNYPANTPKTEKQRDIIELVQKVWSKKPIKLNIVIDGKIIPIEAKFNPELTERSDLSKIAFGNRKGTASEKRITMNLSSDLYQIAAESHYIGSKAEAGKDHAAHTGVSQWHYFITNLVYVEEDGTEIDCYMNIDVKQNEGGNWFYSFAIEKGSCPTDVLSAVTDKTATTSTTIVHQNEEKSNTSDEKTSDKIRKSQKASGETIEVSESDVEQIKKITPEMSDDERTEILSKTNIVSIKDVSSHNYPEFIEIEKIPARAKSQIEKRVYKLAENLGILRNPLSTPQLDIEFQISKNNGLKESLSQQLKYGGDYHDFAKAIVNLHTLLDKAILIETHNKDRYKNTSRNDEHFRAGHVLFSVLNDDMYLYPVKMEIKEKSDTDNSLYLVVAMTKIKRTSVMESTLNNLNKVVRPLSVTGSVYSLPQIISKINPRDKHFLKYFPDQMLTVAQKDAKHEALAEDKAKLEALKIKKSQKASSSTDDRITISRGELAKLKANYEGEKQFNKKDIQNALGKVEALKVLSRKEKNELVSKLFQGYNIRLDSEGYERFSELMYHKIHARILQESDFELSAEELRSADEQIVNALREIVDTGHESIKTKLEQSVSQDGLKKQADYWKNEHKRATEQIKIRGRILSIAQKIKDLKSGAYVNASRYKSETFKGSLEKLARIQFRGNMNVTGTRNIIKEINEWYDDRQNALYSTNADSGVAGRFNSEIKDMMTAIANGNGDLTTNELLMLEKVVSYFAGEIENYNTVLRNGKRVEAAPLAEEYIDKAKKAREINLKCGAVRMLARNRFAVMVADPATLMRQADGYLNGFFTEMFEEMRQGEITSAVREMELTEEFREFWDKTKSYRKRYNQAKINVNGTDISLGYAMSLYMTYKRRHAQAGLVISGFDILDGDKKVTVYKGTDEKLSQKDISRIAKERADELYSQFNENDKKLISIMEGALEECRKLKIDVDMALQHYTNVDNTDYYFPIRRSQIAQNVDMFSMFEGDRVSNLSMNKDTVKGAKNALLIEPAHLVFMRHIKATSLYSGLGIFTDNFNRLYNLNVNGISENTSKSNAEKIINHNRPETIKSTLESDKFPKAMMEYFTEIKKDIEGISTKNQSTSFFNDAVRFIRSNYAKYQLGANPKVWFTQLSSFFAASNILDYSSIVKGFGVKNKKADVDEYCKLAWLRNADDTAANAQAVADKPKAVTDKTAKLSNLLMTPIGMVDRFVVVNLFGACQAQIEKTEGLAIGSKANKVKAGELIERVILETQQNSLASERSAAMRTDNDLLKSFTMFSADAMKGTARMLDAFGEREVLRTLIKKESDPKAKSEHESRLKEVNKNCARSIAAVTMVSVFTALIALAIKSWYRRDDEEDAGTFIADVVGNMLGGIPIIRDFYSFFADGYEMDNFMMSTFNDVLAASLNSFTVFNNAISGKPVSEQEIASAVKKSIFAAGQVSGIPVRNAYNFVTGNINRFLPSTGYKIDNLFYKQSYKADLAKAIENEDEDMIATITGLMLDENIGEIEDSASRKELNRLITAEYDVLPRSVGDTLTYQGETYTLTAAEKKAFKKVYSIANESIAQMVKSSLYKDANDNVKAEAIKFIYNTYYNLALQDYLNEELESKNILFAEAIDIEKLALIIATARSIVADTDKNGKTIAGSKKRKIQAYISSLRLSAAEKYMCMGYLGYTNVNGETQVKAHINKLKLSANEKKKLLEYSGYVA